MRKTSTRIAMLLAALLIAVSAIAVSLLMGTMLSAPVLRHIGPPPPDLAAIEVNFDGVEGWFVAAHAGAPCMLLMHGVRGDRRSMIERARLLRRAGYSSLLFDFQAHGASPGRHITFGHLESANARAGLALLRSKFACAKVGAIGQSLGGAASLLGEGPLRVDLLILESVYPTIEEAVADRLRIRLGSVGALLAPVLTLQLKPLLGVDGSALRPISRIGAYHGPLLIISGAEDQHTRQDETLRLYEAANQPKELWMVAGAAHVDLQRFAPEQYEARVLAFLTAHMPASVQP